MNTVVKSVNYEQNQWKFKPGCIEKRNPGIAREKGNGQMFGQMILMFLFLKIPVTETTTILFPGIMEVN